MAFSILSKPVSEENKPRLGMHRETRTRYGFWLERDHSDQVTNVIIVNPSASSNNEEDLVFLEMVQDLIMDEPVAVIVTPTQGGGKLIEDRGMIVKEISISGTTGYMPRFDGQTVMAKDIGLLNPLEPNQLPSVTDDEALARSGYTAFIKLRNLFRRYSYISRFKPEEARTTYLHYLDLKLEDY